MRNLITAQEVIDLAFAENSNMMAESISDTSIRIAEIKYIRPAFGAMYPLLADKYADFTNDYVKPALAYFVKCEIVSSIAIDMSNSGVAVANPQYQSAATDKQRQRLYDSEMSKAKTLLDFALEYIATHSEAFPDFSGEAPKKHHRVGGILLGGGTSRSQSASIAGEAFKNEIERLSNKVEDLEERVDEIGSGGGGGASDNNYTDADKELVQSIPTLYDNVARNTADITTKQDTLTLTTKSNGNIVIGNLAGESKEFMPATPSGDAQHYLYESAGAVWNADTGYWEMYDMTDVTNIEMSRAFARGSWYSGSVIGALSAQNEQSLSAVRFNIARTGAWSVTIDMDDFAEGNRFIEFINLTFDNNLVNQPFTYATYLQNSFVGCSNLRRIYGEINVANVAKITTPFTGCVKLEDVQLYGLKDNISFADSPLLSKASLLYAIENCASNASFTITLHPDVYEKAMMGEWSTDVMEAIVDVAANKDASVNIGEA